MRPVPYDRDLSVPTGRPHEEIRARLIETLPRKRKSETIMQRTRLIEIDEEAWALAQRAAALEGSELRIFVESLIWSRAEYVRALAFYEAVQPGIGARESPPASLTGQRSRSGGQESCPSPLPRQEAPAHARTRCKPGAALPA